MLPVLGLGLAPQWEQHGDGLWLREEHLPSKITRDTVRHKASQRRLTPEQGRQARALVASGKSLRKVAAHFGVSRMAIWRAMRGVDDPPAEEGKP